MAGLSYYLPGRSPGLTMPDIEALGLAYAFDRKPTAAPVNGKMTPNEGHGVVLADAQKVKRVGCYQDQRWLKIPNVEAYVGYFETDRPTPADLIQDVMVPGIPVRLLDGNDWLIPVARGLREDEDGELFSRCELPKATGIDDAGEWVTGDVVSRYAQLWDLALSFAEAFVEADRPEEGENVAFDFKGSTDGALLALSANYRVRKAEVALLGLFDDVNVVTVLGALIDWPTLARWMKKKRDEGGLNISDGQGVAALAAIGPR